MLSADKTGTKESLPESLKNEIINLAKKYNINRVTLFGSRARKTNRPRSDVDLLVDGLLIDDFRDALDNETETLLIFDVVNENSELSEEFKSEVKKDGVILYEKI